MLTALTAGAMYQGGTLNAQMVTYTIGDIAVVILALRFGKAGWSGLDKFCLLGGTVGIALWALTRDPLYGIVIGLVVTVVGSVPTFEKTWHHPQQEPSKAWVLTTLASTMQSLAIPAWTVADAAQPLTYVSIQAFVCFLIFARPKRFFARA